MNMYRALPLICIAMTLSACANKSKPCEEILEVKRQEQQCEELRKVMNNNQYPQQALTAKIRYQEACLELRYYRDDYDTICKGNQKPIGGQPTENAKNKEPENK
jgi:hypothetical protein